MSPWQIGDENGMVIGGPQLPPIRRKIQKELVYSEITHRYLTTRKHGTSVMNLNLFTFEIVVMIYLYTLRYHYAHWPWVHKFLKSFTPHRI